MRLEFEDDRERERFGRAAKSCCSSIMYAAADDLGWREVSRMMRVADFFLATLTGLGFSSRDVSLAIDMMAQAEAQTAGFLAIRHKLRCPEAIDRQLALMRWAKGALAEAEGQRTQKG